MEDEDEATPPSCVTHLATRTSSVVRYSESTRSSFLTISPSLRVCRLPLKKNNRHISLQHRRFVALLAVA